jgi:transposase
LLSYCHPIKCKRESAGNSNGTRGAKIGNAYLRSAFVEAATLFLLSTPPAQRWLGKKTNRYGRAKAMAILAHNLGRAVYFMLRR